MPNFKVVFTDNILQALVNFRAGIINELLNQNISIKLIAPDDARVIPKLDHRIEWIQVPLERHGKNMFSDLKYFKKIWGIYKREKPNFVFHYTIKPNIYGTIICALQGIPSALMITGLGYAFSKNSVSAQVARLLYKIACKLSKQVIVLNSRDYEYIKTKRIANPSKILWLKGGEGVNVEHYKSTHPLITKPTIDFLFVGRLIKEKGIFELIEAAEAIKQEYPTCEFHILGDFDLTHPESIKPDQIKEFEQKGIIKYHGVVSDIRPFIENADCVLLPSYYNEGLSRSLMEALSMSKPIITTDNPGCQETVKNNENGFIVRKRQVNSLIDGIRNFLLLTNEERLRMGEKSREHATKIFDENLVIAEYLRILSKFTDVKFQMNTDE